MNISLRRGEKIYINGAVFRPDRKVSIELLNDVTFLLENHVMQASDATTPLKQLYFVVQLMLMSPSDTAEPMKSFRHMCVTLNASFQDARILNALALVVANVADNRMFDALRVLRGVFPLETEILNVNNQPAPTKVA
jgi:flagellar protein FlbT